MNEEFFSRDENEIADFVISKATEKDSIVVEKLFLQALRTSNPELAILILENANAKRIPIRVDDIGPFIQAIQTENLHLIKLVSRFYISGKLPAREEAELIRQALRTNDEENIIKTLLENNNFSPQSYRVLLSEYPDTISRYLFEILIPLAAKVNVYPEIEQINEWLSTKPKHNEENKGIIKLLVSSQLPYSDMLASVFGIRVGNAMRIVSAQEFIHDFTENKIDFSFCNLEPYKLDAPIRLEKPMTLMKKGQSPTQILTGSMAMTFTNFLEEKVQDIMPVVMKIFIDADAEYNEKVMKDLNMYLEYEKSLSVGLKYEANVYKYIQEEIVEKNLSPNFVSYLSFETCKLSYISKFMDPKIVNKFIDGFEFFYEHKFMYDRSMPRWAIRMGVLMTESAGNGARFGFQSDNLPVKSMWDTFISSKYMKKDATDTRFWKVMLQLVYSLAVMGTLRINHNDLHPNNILVVQLPEPIDMIFQIGKTQYAINTDLVPYIFDFDFSYAEKFGPNQYIIDYDFLTFDKFSPKRDLYILMCELFGPKTFGEEFIEYSHATQKELEKQLNLTEEQALELAFFAEQNDIKGELFKMSGEQLNKIAPGTVDPNVKKLMFTRQGNTIQFYKGYHCRPTLISADFPTPKKFLKHEIFDQFKIPFLSKQEREENGIKFYYKLPKRKRDNE